MDKGYSESSTGKEREAPGVILANELWSRAKGLTTQRLK